MIKINREQADALSDACKDIFMLGGQIQSGQVELPDCVTFRRRAMQLFEEMSVRAGRGGLPPGDLEEARYALAAYLDELIQYSTWPGRAEWSHQPLQAVLFAESRAGVGFFDRLADVRRRGSAAVLVFYHCLVLGFLGEYRLAGDVEQHDRLVGELARELGGGAKALAPHGRRPDGDDISQGRALLVPATVLCLGISVLVFLALFVWINWAGSDAVEALNQMTRR